MTTRKSLSSLAYVAVALTLTSASWAQHSPEHHDAAPMHRPDPPHTPGFAAPGELPSETSAAPLPGGETQRFVEELDIQGQWWTLFQSAELNALIERGLANNATLEAATAALRQARETLAAGHGAYYPALSGSVGASREQSPGAALGEPQLPSHEAMTSALQVFLRDPAATAAAARKRAEDFDLTEWKAEVLRVCRGTRA